MTEHTAIQTIMKYVDRDAKLFYYPSDTLARIELQVALNIVQNSKMLSEHLSMKIKGE